MEKGFEYWFHNQRTDWQSPYSSSLRAPFDLRQQATVPAFPNACPNMLSPNGSMPVFAFSLAQQPHMKPSQPTEPPRGWFYCMPRFRQAFAPVQNSIPKEKLNESIREAGASADIQKRFVVFDHSGDQTTLMFSSGIEGPTQYNRLPSWSPKPHCAFDFKKNEPALKRDIVHSFQPLLVDEYNEKNEEHEVRSEMHEDTEELNALLYSDDEVDYSEDEEETSTGHSPSTMTGCDRPEWLVKSGEEEEVASSAGPSKRQKLVHGCDVPSLKDTASSVKTNKQCLDYEDDAESSCCGDGKNQVIEELCSGTLSGNKRSRKEKIRDTISILQNLIPGGNKGQDAVVVLDEAIHYLTSLKVKAKALGLDSL